MSPVDSFEHAHGDKTISEEEDENVAQDKDEVGPSLDSELQDFDINEAAAKLEKRSVRINSSSVTLPLCSWHITNITPEVHPRPREYLKQKCPRQ
jgi:hypothetical protein